MLANCMLLKTFDTTEWQHFLESPIGLMPCPYWCYLLPILMSRDSSCLDVIGICALCSLVELPFREGS